MNRARRGSPDERAVSGDAVDGVFVVGMFSSGVELLGDAMTLLGLPRLGGAAEGGEGPRSLEAFNDRLLAGGGSGGERPPAAPVELAHTLAPWLDEARRKMSGVLATAGPGPQPAPWVWADPRLSFLAPFWADALSVRPAVILVHRDPAQVVAAQRGDERADTIGWWDRYNRSAIVLCSRYPSLVVDYDDITRHAKTALPGILDFLGGLGVVLDGDAGPAVEFVERETSGLDGDGSDPAVLELGHRTLRRLLTELGGTASGDESGSSREIVKVTGEFYDEEYYGQTYDKGGVPYRRDEKVWVDYLAAVADSVVKTLRPATALDVGCAVGMLVEALRDRGVDARGFDLSTWAIGQVPGPLQPYCWVGSVTEEIEGHFDLITCMEMLEHLPPSLAEDSVGNLCRHAEMVLFSSTPDDFDEPTHLNVEPSGYWANLFLRHGFVRDLDFDASFISPHAMLFRRGDPDIEGLVESYERALWDTSTRLRSSMDERRRLHERLTEADEVHSSRDALQLEVSGLQQSLTNSEQRRAAENMAAFEMVRRFETDQRRLAGLVEVREAELNAVQHTRTFRYTVRLRRLYGYLRRRRVAPAPVAGPAESSGGTYQLWVELFDTLDDGIRQRIEARIRALPERPRISVMMPVYNPPVEMLRSAIDSVRHQIYPDWELCIADDCSTDPLVVQLLEDVVASDDRIKVIRREQNGHISAASNTALSLVTSPWVALLDHDDLLAEHALAMVAMAIVEHPDAGIVYSDEDKLDDQGHRRDPYFKPDFDPLLLLGQNFVSHLSVFRKDLVDRVGGYRLGYEGSQDWDLTLRLSELIRPEQVVHIPHVLYHWRVHAGSTASQVSAKPYAVEAGLRAVTDHLERTGRPAEVSRIGQWGFNRVVWDLPNPPPKVSIVIPTRDGRLLRRCIDSVLAFTIYPNFEVLVVDNSSRSFETLQYLQDYDQRLTVIRDEQPFNHSAINNDAVARTTGDVVCLLNDDTEVISGEWLTEMVGQLSQPGVGAVGSKLYYADGRIQHAGVILGVHGIAGHAHRNFDRLSVGYFGHLQLAHRMSAVTAACMAVRREAWEQVQGLDAVNLPVVLNDVDFCLRLREAGWDVVWTPNSELFHHESTSRGIDDEGPAAEAFSRAATYMELRWGFAGLRNDPRYNPNLSLDAENFSLAWPPRSPLDADT
jgi:glycosyltransferase involved in cell wall biosynthesis